MTMARQSGSASSSSSVRTSSVIVAWSMALRTAGRSMVTSATPGSRLAARSGRARAAPPGCAEALVHRCLLAPSARAGARRPYRSGGRGRHRSGRSSERQNVDRGLVEQRRLGDRDHVAAVGHDEQPRIGQLAVEPHAPGRRGTNTSRSPTTSRIGTRAARSCSGVSSSWVATSRGDRAQQRLPAAGALGGRVAPVQLRRPRRARRARCGRGP